MTKTERVSPARAERSVFNGGVHFGKINVKDRAGYQQSPVPNKFVAFAFWRVMLFANSHANKCMVAVFM